MDETNISMSARSSNPWKWVAIASAIIVIVLLVWVLWPEEASSPDSANFSPEGTYSENNADFPWQSYPSSAMSGGSEYRHSMVAQQVIIGANATIDVAVAKNLTVGATARVTSAYAFDNVIVGSNAIVDNLYVHSETSIIEGTGSNVKNKVVLSRSQLVNAAQNALGADSTQTQPPPARTSAPTTTRTTTPQVSFVYAGRWDGTFTANSLYCLSGTVTFNVASNGNMTGTVYFQGRAFGGGGGTVDSSGNIRGGWSLDGSDINFSGRFDGSNGSGMYVSGSCSGGFALHR